MIFIKIWSFHRINKVIDLRTLMEKKMSKILNSLREKLIVPGTDFLKQ